MMKSLHVFTEEPSARIVFEGLLPKLLPEDTYFRVYDHQGKKDLEKALRSTVPTISRIPGSKILITRDQDSSDCKELKQALDEIIKPRCNCIYLIRIVCRELESWFLGDFDAIKQAYPRFRPENHEGKSEFRNVDAIHSPNQQLLRIIPEFSGREYLPKIEVAENLTRYLNPEQNRSNSFNCTILGIKKLLET